MLLPLTIIHCDWSIRPAKRWQAQARLKNDRYVIEAPVPVPSSPTRLLNPGRPGPLLIGFDVPFGLPHTYAQQVGCNRFLDFLTWLQRPEWASFFEPAARPADISPRRPFYPARPGGARQQHLLDALGVNHINRLRRRCEERTPGRGPAAPLFWTIGAQQVGKAAISAWREVLLPALDQPPLDVVLWPFSGPLETLLSTRRLTIVEAYPAEYYHQLGIFDDRASKRQPSARLAAAPRLLAWAAENHRRVVFTEPLVDLLRDGFGPSAAGEDPFDALIGLLGMLNVVVGNQPPGEPAEPAVRNIEGWIFGQASA